MIVLADAAVCETSQQYNRASLVQIHRLTGRDNEFADRCSGEPATSISKNPGLADRVEVESEWPPLSPFSLPEG